MPCCATSIELLSTLITCPSITPNDAGAQEIIKKFLAPLGFSFIDLPFKNVSNLFARIGTEAPLVVFAGHTDVVPSGDLQSWDSPPFEPTIRDKKLYGRGACDMKGSLSAMLIATQQFLESNPSFNGSLGFLITSNEEGDNIGGTEHALAALTNKGITIDYSIVGEPTADNTTGDVIKIGRRGSLHAHMTIHGKQGHVAYPQLADNPIHRALKALDQLVNTPWNDDNPQFPATTCQISNMHAGTGAKNVIPSTLTIDLNFRYSPANTISSLQKRLLDCLQPYDLDARISWQSGALPFLTEHTAFLNTITAAIQSSLLITPTRSTSGGTSDARFFAALDIPVIELGPPNKTIHQINECIALNELERLEQVYQKILENLLTLS